MQAFLEALYGDLPEDAWWYLWTLSPEKAKHTQWFQDCEAGAAYAETLQNLNVYYPVAWSTEKRSNGQRLEMNDVDGIIGLVSDVDLKDTNKPHSPPTIAAAELLITKFPVSPTTCIHSGHGLQCIWLFKEPWVFETDSERQDARDLSKAWAYTLAGIASQDSYELDAVHDLTRVMRLPGTVNVKDPERPVPVKLLWHKECLRCNPQDFEKYLLDVGPVGILRDVPVVDVSCSFPMEKHEALLDIDDDYRTAWKHERKLPRDNSCSGFDMALANRMVAAGLGNDEIVPILQEHRRRFGQAHPEKVNDARYFARTIARARENSNKEAAQQEAVEVLSDTDSARDEAIKALATRWQIPLTNVQVVTGDPACFRFWIGGRCAVIGAPDMVSQTRFLGEMISVAQVYPLPVGNKEKPGWRDYVNTICRIAERIEAGDDATRDGNFSALLVDFLEERGIEDFPEGTLLPYSIGPFRRDGRLWLRLRDLVQFLRVYDSHVKRGEVVQRLRALGAVAKPHAREGRKAGTSSTAHFYGVEEEKMRSV